MAIACDSQTLVNQAQCLFPCIPPGMSKYIKLALLCAAVNGSSSMDCSAQNLVNQALCLQKCIPPGMTDAIEIYLLCQLVNGGGTGGSAGVTCGVVAPTTAPSGGLCGLYVNTATGSLYYWDGAAWQVLIV